MSIDTKELPVPVAVALAPRVRIAKFAEATGLTPKAIQRKIEDHKWREGKEYHRDPDGCIWIDVRGAMAWVGRETA
jgi:hypothetical protein